FLTTTFAGSALADRAFAEALLDRGFARVDRIADGVYATIADSSQGQQCASNGGVIAGRDAVLIVEGHFQPAGAELEVEAARRISKAPIRAAVNTHYHLDHTFGNAGYRKHGVPILAHQRSFELMRDRYTALRGVDRTSQLAPLQRRLANAANPSMR